MSYSSRDTAHTRLFKANFRFITLSPEVQVTDANEALLMQVKQKMLTLREATTYADETEMQPIYRVQADRITGFRAVHTVTRLSGGQVIGSLRAAGLRNIRRARYDVTDAQGNVLLHIQGGNHMSG